jgi:hypothetical protein
MGWQQTFDVTWGVRISDKRKNMGLTLDQVQGRTGIARLIIWRAEFEPSRVPVNKLVALLEFYGVAPKERMELCSAHLI